MPSQDRAPLALAFGGLFALAAAMGIGRFVYTPIQPFMSDGLKLTAEDAGLIASANFLGYLLGAVAAASRSLPGTARFWFLGALFVSALTSAAMAATTSLPVFLIIRLAGGIASAFVLVFSTTLILERLNAAGRGDLSALHFAGVGCGIAFSALLVAGLSGIGANWRVLWLAGGAATLVFLLIAARLVPGQPADSGATRAAGNPPPASKSRYLNGAVLRLILAYGLFGFGYVITATFVSVIARATPALQSSEAFVWLAVGLSAVPSILVWNRIAFHIGARRAFALACLLEACGVALTAVADIPVLFLAGAALLGATFMGITALGLIEARRLAGPGGAAAIRQMLAVLTASFGVGQIVGPWFAGQLHDLTGSFQAPSLAAAAVLLVAALLMLR
ncbi:YbfB/YjiJ family MFS transporter [Labrenzia sp. 011]|uniref:YbfB/YjiJ family MFS transporter n=1 Tax=Labrenzia sp. 011 TaxID=2171494 RepID=UPI000D5100D8|nr:YbfB/YjiJ family MFS transporter [Labrenzia sp. 011]PVB61116.1 hypothetical protein DCO57_13995 [Labrenzia sp. 011]